MFRLGLFFAFLSALQFSSPAQAFHHGGVESSVISSLCPKGTGLTDLGGTPDNCLSATQYGSYQDSNFFNDARQSGQSTYYYNDGNLNYNIPCIDNPCGYNTTTSLDDPANVSFSASSGTITSGVLTINPANLDATNGNVALNQYVGWSGTAPTSSSPYITSYLGSNEWQLSQNTTVAGTPAVTGSRFPQIGCAYRTTIGGISSSPIVNCPTTGDTSTPTNFAAYDMSDHGGVWLRIPVGSGGGSGGTAAPITITNNKFTCNATGTIGGVVTLIGTHFDLYITHNSFDGGYSSTCPTGTGTVVSNSTIGTSGQSQIFDMEWNVFQDGGGDQQAGIGDYTNITIANNAFLGFNLAGTDHGAVYANSLRNPMGSYTYEHNLCLYPSTAPAELGTTCYSILANASDYPNATIGAVSFLGNIAISNCHGGTCSGSTWTNTEGLWANNDPPYYASLTSIGNLTDQTGVSGGSSGAIYKGGPSRNESTASEAGNSGAHNTTITVSSINDYWPVNSFIHVNTTPYTWNATITPNGDNATATMTVTGSGISTLAAGFGVAGVLVPPGMSISAKTSNTVYTVVNYYCSYTTTCTDAQLTAPLQAMYSVCTILPYGTTDPNTGLASTGTGKNTGTYMAACVQTQSSLATFTRFNPGIGSYPPSVNEGNDYLLTTGAPTYLGGTNWSSGISP